MTKLNNLLCLCAAFLFAGHTFAQERRVDTAVKMGDIGYRVICSNKNNDLNDVSVAPVGTRSTQRTVNFSAPGRVNKVIVDDLNGDGLPDLVLCIFGGQNGETGTVIGISYAADKTLMPVYFPDIYIDPKLREGYKGHDEFSMVAGTLLRKFPLYLPGDAVDKPTGGKRTVQYNVVSEQGRMKFNVLRFFDTKPEQ